MAQKHFYSPQAEQDLNDIAHYIAQNNLEAALHFVDAVEETCTQLAEMPDMGRIFRAIKPELNETRMMRVSKTYSAYLIFYRQTKKRLEVIRVLHGAQDILALFE